MRLLAGLSIALASLATVVAAEPQNAAMGERRLLAAQPHGAVRDAQGRPDLRVTVWHPTTSSALTTSIDIGPPDEPYFILGDVAPDAPFARAEPRPAILLSHGFGGASRTMAWFGGAMTQRGYSLSRWIIPATTAWIP